MLINSELSRYEYIEVHSSYWSLLVFVIDSIKKNGLLHCIYGYIYKCICMCVYERACYESVRVLAYHVVMGDCEKNSIFESNFIQSGIRNHWHIILICFVRTCMYKGTTLVYTQKCDVMCVIWWVNSRVKILLGTVTFPIFI